MPLPVSAARTGPSIRPSDFQHPKTPKTRQERLGDCGKLLPLWRRGKLITRYCHTDCNVSGCRRCGSPNRKQVKMWKRRGASGRNINQRMREQALAHLQSEGITEVLVYDSTPSKAQQESVRRVTKGRWAPIGDASGRMTLLIPAGCSEFVISRLGKPDQQSPLDGFALEQALGRAPVTRMSGMLSARRFHSAPVAQEFSRSATGARSNLEAQTLSIRPSSFETDARDLGMRTREELHQMGYRLHDDPTSFNIDADLGSVVPLSKEDAVQTEHTELLRRIAANTERAAANTAVLPKMAKDISSIRKILADYDAGRISRNERDSRIGRWVN